MAIFASFVALLATCQAASPVATNNLDSLITNDKLKFVFVGGKGGVGKTTSSSAIASQLSLSTSNVTNSNKRVLLISTDPAHSLSDAFRMKFSNTPTPIMPDLPNLEVMEVNPRDTMQAELSEWVDLATEMGYDPTADGAKESGGIGEQIHAFQEWLSGIPGIDEATALSSAIEHIESGRYDTIVFDTAPTGHTLKLLELPGILQVGLDKLEGWQAKLWGYWEVIKGMAGGSGSTPDLKERVAKKLKDYKAQIGRVASMITDKERTRFVVVCIAEFLSISESRRLLSELDRFQVQASHVVVNQLVTDYLEAPELRELERHVESLDGEKRAMLEKALAATRLTTARRNIQSKYLKDLKMSPEVRRQPDAEDPTRTNRLAGTEPLTVLEVPLLPTEVTGPKAILEFSHYLIGKEVGEKTASSVGVEGERSRKARADEASGTPMSSKAEPSKGKRQKGEGKGPDMKKLAGGIVDLVMANPELAEMVNKNPKLVEVLGEVKENPFAGMKYLTDPEVQPFIKMAMPVVQKAMLGASSKGPELSSVLGGAKEGGGGGLDMDALLGALGGGDAATGKRKKATGKRRREEKKGGIAEL